MFAILATSCDTLAPIIKFVKNGIFPIIQFGIPILIIILGSVDLGKAVVGGDEKKTKEATNTLLKRFGYGVAVFFIPIIVDLVFGMFDETGNNELKNYNIATCWNKINEAAIPDGSSCHVGGPRCIKGTSCIKNGSTTAEACDSTNDGFCTCKAD